MTLTDSRQHELPRIQPFATRDELVSALASSFLTVGEQITLIGRSIPLGLGRTIDLLGVDRVGHLVFVVATHDEGDVALLEILDLAAWIEESEVLFNRLLALSVGETRGARLLLLASGFSRRVLHLAEVLKRMRIELVQYRRVVVGGRTALLLDNFSAGRAALVEPNSTAPATNRSATPSGAQSTPLPPSGVQLTRREVDELTRPLGMDR